MSYSYLDLAYDVLKGAAKPMLYQEIWEMAVARGLDANLARRERLHGKVLVRVCMSMCGTMRTQDS